MIPTTCSRDAGRAEQTRQRRHDHPEGCWSQTVSGRSEIHGSSNFSGKEAVSHPVNVSCCWLEIARFIHTHQQMSSRSRGGRWGRPTGAPPRK